MGKIDWGPLTLGTHSKLPNWILARLFSRLWLSLQVQRVHSLTFPWACIILFKDSNFLDICLCYSAIQRGQSKHCFRGPSLHFENISCEESLGVNETDFGRSARTNRSCLPAAPAVRRPRKDHHHQRERKREGTIDKWRHANFPHF